MSEQLEENQYFQQRLAKADGLRAAGINPYPNGFKLSHDLGQIVANYQNTSKETLEAEKITARIAGRVMMIRSFGKAAFILLRDHSGDLQAYVKKGEIPDEQFEVFKTLDTGDFAYVEGFLFRTKTDELTLHANQFSLAVKGLRPLPEKWHGLTDVEARYRQRYVDLIANTDVREVFRKRAIIIQKIRDFFNQRGFLECETPMMQSIPGGAKAKPFITHHNALDMQLYLRIAPELFLKRLVVGGFERVFEINRNFRNEGISIQHNPEFTMLEFYQAYATYEDLIHLSETLLQDIAIATHGSTTINYQNTDLSFAAPFKRIKMYDAIVEIGGAPADIISDKVKAIAYAKDHHLKLASEKLPLPVILTEIFEQTVEKQLIQPTFITHYPTEVSPLSRRSESDPSVTDRFELFIFGREIANGFSELNDPIDQKQRFMDQVAARSDGDDEAMYMDEDFVTALEYGMPPTAGEGIGIDRLVMLFTNQASIRDVILFPQMRRS